MTRYQVVGLLAAFVLPVTALPPTAGGATPPRTHVTRQAERNVLHVLARVWPKLLHHEGLVDEHSGLLRDNVQTTCRAPNRRAVRGSTIFLCTVRARLATKSVVLHVRYGVLERKGFRLRLTRLTYH
jgi:hypothetical protein